MGALTMLGRCLWYKFCIKQFCKSGINENDNDGAADVTTGEHRCHSVLFRTSGSYEYRFWDPARRQEARSV